MLVIFWPVLDNFPVVASRTFVPDVLKNTTCSVGEKLPPMVDRYRVKADDAFCGGRLTVILTVGLLSVEEHVYLTGIVVQSILAEVTALFAIILV